MAVVTTRFRFFLPEGDCLVLTPGSVVTGEVEAYALAHGYAVQEQKAEKPARIKARKAAPENKGM